ncbi:energy transducer TonB [Nitrospiraceae bacterium AH_259_D15_M11_P09]|nr:energy transducer TonB [Nitrospiraceae bacterium AH_259_D15_M11_P09]
MLKRDPGRLRRHLESWTASILLHGLIVGVAVLLVSGLELDPQPEPFRWEVSVVELASSTGDNSPAPTDSRPQPVPPGSERVERRLVETQPGIQTVQTQTMGHIKRREPIVRQPVQRQVTHVRPVRSTLHQMQVVARTIQPIEARQRRGHAVTEPTHVVKPQAVVREPEIVEPARGAQAVPQQIIASPRTISPLESSVVSRQGQDKPQRKVQTLAKAGALAKLPPEIQANEVVRTAKLAETVAKQVTTQTRSAAKASVIAQPVVQSAQALPVPHKPRTIDAAKRVPTQTAINTQPATSRPASKPDYGWLADALYRKIDHLKRYPSIARLNHWEGRVLLRAAVRADGQLVDLDVAESSGHPVLDQDALEIMRRASPLELKHALGKPQVVVNVPVSYTLRP